MTHQNFQTNGASLEDCHTNFFALTELSGIKWRKLVWFEGGTHGVGGHHHHHHQQQHHHHHQQQQQHQQGSGEPLQDPVLLSYARCLAADILCVWRRVPTPRGAAGDVFELGGPPPSNHQPPPPLSLHASKELWIFWYGEEPDLHDLVVPELNSTAEQGSWESGLSYECRSLLFKALHNLIERCLLSRDFIRLGRWFVQPHDAASAVTASKSSAAATPLPSPGQPLRQEAHGGTAGEAGTQGTCSTHLSFSFAFFVHGESSVCASVDVRQHPPVRRLGKSHLARAQQNQHGLRVILAPYGLAGQLTGQTFKSPDGSSRLLDEWSHFYPLDRTSSLTESSVVEVIVGGVRMKYPSCYVFVTDMDDLTNNRALAPSPLQTPMNQERLQVPIGGIAGKPQVPTALSSVLTPPTSPVQVNSRVPQPGSHPVSVEHSSAMSREHTACTVLPERVWQECIHGGPPHAPDRPACIGEFSGNWDFVDPLRRCSCTCSTKSTGPYTPQGGPPSYPRTQESLAVLSVGSRSPASVAPSPLPNPSSQQPPSVPPGTADQQLPAPSPLQLPSTPARAPATPRTPAEPPKSELEARGEASPAGSGVKTPGTKTTTAAVLRRPTLSSREYEAALGEEEQPLEMLYDYSTMDAWLQHPVKRYKMEDKSAQKISRLLKQDIYSLYTQHSTTTSTTMTSTSATTSTCLDVPLSIKPPPYIKQEVNHLPMEAGELPEAAPISSMPHGLKRPGDPYEFEEEGGCNMDGFKRGQAPPPVLGKEEPKRTPNPFTPGAPDSHFMDQMFDNSDYTSSDEAMQVNTPPGSTSLGNHHDSDTKRYSGGSMGGCPPNMGIVRPEELSKMFPTPPSQEHTLIASPCGGQLDPGCSESTITATAYTDLGIIRIKQEIYPNMGSPPEEPIEDWSFVFKPPTICRMVGSSKYAPLTNLPSQNLTPVSLPSHCVYKPSWVQHLEKPSTASTSQQQQQQQQPSITSSGGPPSVGTTTATGPPTAGSTPNPRGGTPGPLNAFPPSPLTPLHHHQGTAGFRPPPPPYESHPSPATLGPGPPYHRGPPNVTPSSVMDSSALMPHHPGHGRIGNPAVQVGVPWMGEASSLVLNILLTDTAINIFRDHNFDSCTLCVCNAGVKVVGNIRGADAGVYLLQHSNSTSTNDRVSSAGGHHGLQPPGPGSPFHHVGMGGMLPSPTGHHGHHQSQNSMTEEDSIRCSCGFSAVVNRRLAHGSGLFYEDEMEITGIAEDPGEKKKAPLSTYLIANSTVKLDPSVDREQLDIFPHALVDLIREQCVFIPSTANALYRSAQYFRSRADRQNQNGAGHLPTVHTLEYTDGNEVTIIALEHSKHHPSLDSSALTMCKMQQQSQDDKNKITAVHQWPFLRARGPPCNQDIVRVMRQLQPLLQGAIQKKCQTRLWEAPSAVNGPLTWRQFHRLAGRGTDDRCEPQPIPALVVGHDKDWLSLSPYAVHHWETLLLEPYSYARDIAYVVVAPDNEAVLPRVRSFFKELSTAYEMCKLGRHAPITKVLRDGILRVGRAAKAKIGQEPVEEWFTLLGEGEVPDMLRLYAQVCKHHLAPHLQQVPMDKTLLEPPEMMNQERPAPSPMPSSVGSLGTPDGTPEKAPGTPKSVADQEDSGKESSLTAATAVDNYHDDDEREAPAIVVYLVEPFSLGSDEPELQRLACVALLRCYQSILASLPETLRNNVSVQVISLESISELCKARDRVRHSDHMRALAMNIFTQSRRLLVHTSNVKSLTGFGTAAVTDTFLKSKDEKNRAPYRLYTPPYILAPIKEKAEALDSWGKGSSEQASVLYLSYCLSEDQSWLLAVATDDRGEIQESININVDVPNRSRRKKASARRIGLEKLMHFTIGVMSQSARPWRLVVGRLGRIGHGELKGWSWLLSRKNLLKASKHLKEICQQCSLLYPNSVPCILSACLVSLEPDSVLRLMPDQFTPDERFSQASVKSQLSTPQDVSCTHILVFPTSAITLSSQTAFQEQHITPELGEDALFDLADDDMAESINSINVFSDIFDWTDNGPGGPQSPSASPRREDSTGVGSPPIGDRGGQGGRCGQGSPYSCGGGAGGSSKGGSGVDHQAPEEVGTVLQQPLALGYLVSTAPTGKMPRWFWSSCPHLEGVCPAFLKNALHLHSPNVQQSSEDLFPQSNVTSHPLDSQYTTDVLRYVLEGYNALSWLALDSNTRDRLSCLPVHMQLLVQLYHITSALL